MTPVEFTHAIKYITKEEEEHYKIQMEASRFLAMHMWNSAGKSMKRPEWDVQKLIPFTWDRQVVKKQTVQEMMSTMFGIASQQNAYVKQMEKRKKTKRHE